MAKMLAFGKTGGAMARFLKTLLGIILILFGISRFLI